jgi:hypothetical protein
MKSKLLEAVGLGVLATLVGAGSAQAADESLGLSVTVGHSASAAGQERSLTGIAGTAVAPFNQPGPRSIINSIAVRQSPNVPFTFRRGAETLTTVPVPTTFYSGPSALIILEPAQTAYAFNHAETYGSTTDLIKAVQGAVDSGQSNFDFDYRDDCFQNIPRSIAVGLPVSTNYQLCDALDATITLSGVNFRFVAAENNPNIAFTIPEVGFSYTSAALTTIPIFKRAEAFAQVGDNFNASGKADEVALRLLGVSTLPAKGVLPASGQFFALDFTVARSASGQTQFSPALAAARYSKAFGFGSAAEAVGYVIANRNSKLTDFNLGGFEYISDCFRTAPQSAVLGHCDSIDATVTVLGVSGRVVGAENNPDLAFSIPDIGYSKNFTGLLDRDSAISAFGDDLDSSGALKNLVSKMLAAYAATRPDDALIGNPNSLQGSLNRAVLNLDEPSEVLDEAIAVRRESDPSGWMVGGRIGTYSSLNSDTTFAEGVVERSFRLGEGSRSLFKVSAPFNFSKYDNGDTQSSATGRIAYEKAILSGKWAVEPSAAIGYVFQSGALDSGALYTVGVSSRYKIAPVGRGHIIIGNAITYSSTIPIENDSIKTAEVANTAFRNGVAYQMPVGERVFGRQTWLRASYTYTNLTGDDVFLDKYHDVSVSYGFGSKESTVRQAADTFRIGLSGVFGKEFNSYSLNLGYRF